MKKVLLFALLTFIYNSTNAQELISSSSGYAEKDGNKISWSIGEVVIGTVESGNTKLTQGFLQPLIIDIFPTGIEEMYRLEMTAYPNPVYDKVIFKGEDPTGKYDIRLVDKTGKVLDQKGIDYRDLSLDMKKYNYGTYFIEVVQKGTNKRRIFRIIKSSKNN